MRIRVHSSKLHIDVELSEFLFQELKNFDFFQKYIPDCNVETTKENSEENILVIEECESLSFKFHKGSGNLSCKLGKNINKHAIVVVIDYCLDYTRQKNGSYCVHGSAISKKDFGILILGGASGLGKTTLALNLCSKEGFEFIGDDKVLINNNLEIEGGAKMIEFNKPALYISVDTNLQNKKIDDLEKIIKIKHESVPIKIGIQPNINPGGNLEVEKWPQEKIDFHLYEEMSRKIRGISKRISDSTYPLQSIDNEELAIARSNFAKQLSLNIPFYTIKGDLDLVINEILRLLQL